MISRNISTAVKSFPKKTKLEREVLCKILAGNFLSMAQQGLNNWIKNGFKLIIKKVGPCGIAHGKRVCRLSQAERFLYGPIFPTGRENLARVTTADCILPPIGGCRGQLYSGQLSVYRLLITANQSCVF